MVDKGISEEFGFWDKLKYLFSNPNLFFDKIKTERGIKNSLLMYSIIGAFFSVVSYVLSFIGSSTALTNFASMGASSGFYIMLVYAMPLIFFGIGVLITFLYSALIHITLIAFKSQSGYAETYKVYTYSMIPGVILSVIPLVGYISLIYSFIIMTLGISKLHNVSKGKAALAVLLPGIIILGVLIFMILSFFMSFNLQ
jgi:hypothetical protein